MFYVRIDGISDNHLAFLGYTLVFEDHKHRLYRNYMGEEYAVPKHGKQYLLVEDMNDAQILSDMSGSKVIVRSPP
ncbi:MAG: hypothetical protein V3U60_16375 [Gammaproteobacteria bacterium]